MKRLKLSIGIDDFAKLRKENFYYIDKTGLISELLDGWSEVNLFTRPRRFGKTLNMTMLKSFFEPGIDPIMFEGLEISRRTDLCETYMGKYPVVFVSFKGIDALDFEGARSMLVRTIISEVMRFQYLLDSDVLTDHDKKYFQNLLSVDMSDGCLIESLKTLTDFLYKYHRQKVVLLIDEYDVPLDKGYQRGYYNQILALIRNMFHAVLKTNSSLYLAVMTGCLRVSKESIFTGLNNLRTFTISDVGFDEYFGFTEAEVQKLLIDYGLIEHHDVIKEWYDGYRFGKQDVYCPWDVLNYCYDLLQDSDTHPKAYWKNTSGNQIVRKLIEHTDSASVQAEIEVLLAGGTIRKAINEQLTYDEINRSIGNIWSVLFMTGYLTVAEKPESRNYSLTIPNREVLEIFKEQVLEWFHDKTRADETRLNHLFRAFSMGAIRDIEESLNQQLLDTVSFHDAYESFYHGFLLALLSACSNWSVISNAETGKGRSDILVEQKDRQLGLVIEVKYVNDETRMHSACEQAIRQIEDRDYTAHLRKYRFKDIWIYGIAFCDKMCMVVAKHLT